jgi:hypothetical protein
MKSAPMQSSVTGNSQHAIDVGDQACPNKVTGGMGPLALSLAIAR